MVSSIKIQDRIWYDLVTSNYQGIYASIFNTRIRNLSDKVNLYTSVVTSASVGGWAVWQDFPAIWGAIIATSQLINISKPYISKIRDYELYHELQLYYQERHFELDNLWLNISLGELSENDIKNQYKSIYEKYFNLSKKFLKTRIEVDNTIAKQAEAEWNKNLAKYGISDE